MEFVTKLAWTSFANAWSLRAHTNYALLTYECKRDVTIVFNNAQARQLAKSLKIDVNLTSPKASPPGKHPHVFVTTDVGGKSSNVTRLTFQNYTHLLTPHMDGPPCYQCNGFTSIKTVRNHSRTAAKRTTTQDPIDIEHLPLVKIQMFAFNIQKCRVGN